MKRSADKKRKRTLGGAFWSIRGRAYGRRLLDEARRRAGTEMERREALEFERTAAAEWWNGLEPGVRERFLEEAVERGTFGRFAVWLVRRAESRSRRRALPLLAVLCAALAAGSMAVYWMDAGGPLPGDLSIWPFAAAGFAWSALRSLGTAERGAEQGRLVTGYPLDVLVNLRRSLDEERGEHGDGEEGGDRGVEDAEARRVSGVGYDGSERRGRENDNGVPDDGPSLEDAGT